MFEKCTNTSGPSSRLMKPKPFWSLKNFTVPVAIPSLLSAHVPHPTLGRGSVENLIDPRRKNLIEKPRPACLHEPVRRAVEHLDLGPRPEVAVDLVDGRLRQPRLGRHDRESERRPLPCVLAADLGRGHVEPVACDRQ